MVQASPSSQVVTQAPSAPLGIPGSQASPAAVSRTPLPHAVGQSMSLSLVAPGGQQLSGALPDGAIGAQLHTAEQVPSEIGVPMAHVTMRQSAVVGQAPSVPDRIAVSQVSPGSTTPLPQELPAQNPPG